MTVWYGHTSGANVRSTWMVIDRVAADICAFSHASPRHGLPENDQPAKQDRMARSCHPENFPRSASRGRPPLHRSLFFVSNPFNF